MAASADNAKTITVVSNTSRRVGQVIFETSDRTCCINLKGLVVAIIHFFLLSWHLSPLEPKFKCASGRGSRVRTRDLRFWRPPLYQLSYTPTMPLPNHHIYEFQPIFSPRYTPVDKNYKSVIEKYYSLFNF